MSRTRTVYPTVEIAHLWAHQSAPHARNPGNSFWFNGPVIYSYGSHFPIARIVTGDSLARIVLFTTKGYSTTTNRHKGMVRNAVPSYMRVVEVADVMGNSWDHERVSGANVSAICDDVRDALAKAYRARSNRDTYLCRARERADDAQFLAAFYGHPVPQFPSLDVNGGKEIAQAQARLKVTMEQQRQERMAQRARDLAETVEGWKRGDILDSTRLGELPAILRVSPSDPAEAQTSHGARFPVDHARKLWPVLVAMRDGGRSYIRNGHSIHLGEYVLDSFNAITGELRAGCHVLAWTEIERFAQVLGLIDATAQRSA